jgi:hypothetical protein
LIGTTKNIQNMNVQLLQIRDLLRKLITISKLSKLFYEA